MPIGSLSMRTVERKPNNSRKVHPTVKPRPQPKEFLLSMNSTTAPFLTEKPVPPVHKSESNSIIQPPLQIIVSDVASTKPEPESKPESKPEPPPTPSTSDISDSTNTEYIPDIKYPERVTLKEVNEYIEDSYTQAELVLSTSLDILALYLKSEKFLYIEAKVYCEQQLNYLMLPAIMISAFCTVLSLALSGTVGGPILISCLTAVNSFILSLISYLKLDAKAEAHKTSAYQYDKLQSIAEFNSGKVMFFSPDKLMNQFLKTTLQQTEKDKDHAALVVNPANADAAATQKEAHQHDDNVNNLLDAVETSLHVNITEMERKNIRASHMIAEITKLVHTIETKVNEIKEMNKFILPEKIRHNYINTYNNNIFASLKKVQTKDTLLRTQLLNKINAIKTRQTERDYYVKYKNILSPEGDIWEYINRVNGELKEIKVERDNILQDIIKLREEYTAQDYKITTELYRVKDKKRCNCFQWLKT